jgi:hypothetical protein
VTTLRLSVLTLLCVFFSACVSATLPQTAIPTQDTKALATKIAANIFATQTAIIPTATNSPPATVAPSATNTPEPTQTPFIVTVTPSYTPVIIVVTATALPTNLPKLAPIQPTESASPTPTPEPWLVVCGANIQKGMGEMVFSNYMGQKEIVILIGKNRYIAQPMSDTPVPLPPGNVEVNFTAPGWGPNWNWVRKLTVEAGYCYHQWVYYNPR